MRYVAYLMPIHEGVANQNLQEAFASIGAQRTPEDISVRLYVGIDGPISKAKEALVDAAAPYCVVTLRRHSGLPTVLNRLIGALGNEEYVFRMDGDDICERERTAAQFEFMENNPSIGICGTACTQIDERGDAICVRRYPTDPKVMRRFICKAIPLLHPTFCFRRSALENLRYDEARFYQQDLTILFDALAAGIELGNLHEPLLRWRTGEAFYKRRSVRRALAECYLYVRGITRLHGPTWRYIYPFFRLVMRCLPQPIQVELNRRNLRQILVEP